MAQEHVRAYYKRNNASLAVHWQPHTRYKIGWEHSFLSLIIIFVSFRANVAYDWMPVKDASTM